MSISLFGYILLAAATLLAAYLAGVAKYEPPLEHYESAASDVRCRSGADGSSAEG
jgi:hypothetical protein